MSLHHYTNAVLKRSILRFMFIGSYYAIGSDCVIYRLDNKSITQKEREEIIREYESNYFDLYEQLDYLTTMYPRLEREQRKSNLWCDVFPERLIDTNDIGLKFPFAWYSVHQIPIRYVPINDD